MNVAEASSLVLRLLNKWPGSNLAGESSAEYENALLRFDVHEAESAIDALFFTSKFLPHMSEIQAEINSIRRERTRQSENSSRRLGRAPTGQEGGASRAQWGASLPAMLEASAKYEAMARPWFSAMGKPYTGDPGLPFIQLAQRGSAGEDVTEQVRVAVDLPKPTHQDPTPEEFDVEEWDRRFP